MSISALQLKMEKVCLTENVKKKVEIVESFELV